MIQPSFLFLHVQQAECAGPQFTDIAGDACLKQISSKCMSCSISPSDLFITCIHLSMITFANLPTMMIRRAHFSHPRRSDSMTRISQRSCNLLKGPDGRTGTKHCYRLSYSYCLSFVFKVFVFFYDIKHYLCKLRIKLCTHSKLQFIFYHFLREV